MLKQIARLAAILCAGAAVVCGAESNPVREASLAMTGAVHVDVTPARTLNELIPLRVLGAGVDSVPSGAIAKIYTPANRALMLSAGHGAVSYRLFTELSVQAWHWNSAGTWSDPAGAGYFTGSADQSDPSPIVSFGYDLPHSGTTLDQGAQDGYSRVSDGDLNTYWKSNPYLSKAYTGENDSLHPQWIIVDLGATKDINAVHIDWGNPFAVDYSIQYWDADDPIKSPAEGTWQTFSTGIVRGSPGGSVTVKVTDSVQSVRFVRVLMTASSGTFDSHGSGDPRNGMGYAVFEIGVGNVGADGSFQDAVRHTPSQKQTVTYASSVDPWHDPAAKNTNQEQATLAQVFNSGLTRSLPTMVPVALLYGIPDDAAAEVTYLKAKGYPISYIELGEEPDGQYISPEDYGALYLQFASAIHAVDPAMKLGGPSFQAGRRIQTWPDAAGETAWLKRFLNYLKARGRQADLNFFSFEHYPFKTKEGAAKTAFASLLLEPARIAQELGNFRADGLPPDLPVYVTEYNFSADNSPATLDIAGALWHADFIGSFLALGGNGAFYYEYEPTPPEGSKGTLGMFFADKQYRATARASQFFSTRMIMLQWLTQDDAIHAIYPAVSTLLDGNSIAIVTAYAAKRPDGQWAVMLINKSESQSAAVSIDFKNAADESRPSFAGPVTVVTFGADQFRGHGRTVKKGAIHGDLLVSTTLDAAPATFNLPKASITVIRGALK